MISCLQPEINHGSQSLPWRTLLLTLAALSGYLILGSAPEAWVFDREAIRQGEYWRLITGHWVHSDLGHALWDIAALAILGALFESRLQGKLLLSLAAGTMAVNIWLWWGAPSLDYYCGLSGILNSLLAVGLIQLWRELHHPLIVITALGVISKILLEIYQGQALLTHTAWPSVPEVHAVGFLCGLVLEYWYRKIPKNGQNPVCQANQHFPVKIDTCQKHRQTYNRDIPTGYTWSKLCQLRIQLYLKAIKVKQ